MTCIYEQETRECVVLWWRDKWRDTHYFWLIWTVYAHPSKLITLYRILHATDKFNCLHHITADQTIYSPDTGHVCFPTKADYTIQHLICTWWPPVPMLMGSYKAVSTDQNLYVNYQLIYWPEKILIGNGAKPGEALSDLMMPYDAIRRRNNWYVKWDFSDILSSMGIQVRFL